MVLARSGRLAELGGVLEFVADLLRPRLRAAGSPVEILVRDSGSTAERARAATEELIRDEGVQVVLSLGGTATLPAVADACERLATPSVSTTLPWQFFHGRRDSWRWSFHFCWGIDDLAAVFADMWELAAGRGVVGCLWNDGPQGTALRDPRNGFVPTASARGHTLVLGTGYPEPTADFSTQINEFLDGDVRVVTSAAAAEDLAAFLARAEVAGLRPHLVTCSRWLTYPFHIARYGLDGVATIVSWTPHHRYVSSLDGLTPSELAEAYERATGRPWSQPLGLAYALFEVAVHALASAVDPTDRSAVAEALRRTRLDTIAGTLDWTRGPVPNVATVPLAGGQWRLRERPELVVVTNSRVPSVSCSGELEPVGTGIRNR